MTSNSPTAYPAEYYHPEFIENRSVSSHVSYPASSPPLSTSIKATTNSTKQRTKNVAMNIVTNHGLPDSDINESAKTDPKKYLIRDPGERNIPKLIVDENMLRQNMRSPTILSINREHNKNLESKPIPNGHTNENFMKRTRPITSIRKQHQVVKFAEDEQPTDEYWKKEILIDDEGVVAIEPIKYDKNTYEGPFGLTRKGSFIFYIGMAIFTLLAAVFLIMTGVFYGQSYPDSSANTGKLAGIGICAFAFYIGLQLIFIALWHQKYRQENPVRKIKKRSTVHNESQDYLKPSMENNNKPTGHSYQPPVDYSYQPPVDYSYQPPVDYSYQPPVDYTPYGYYSNPPYTNEQMLLQQPGAATGAASYDTVVWPSNVEVETQPDTKFLQPMDYSLGLQRQSTVDTTSPFGTDARLSNQIKKSKRERTKPVEAEPAVIDFDDMGFNSTVIKQPLPILPKAPETMELMQTLAQIPPTTTEKSPTNGAVSPKKTNRIQPLDNRTDVSSSINHDKNHHHHHRRHHHHHHHHRHRPHRHHRHHHNKDSASSQYTNSSYESHRERTFDHHHRDPSVSFPRIVTPQLPKIITPSLSKMNTTMYRETGSNTGNETKLTRDSSVTADLADIPNVKDNRLEQIPVLYRTIIVEPYPAQPSSQILVKPNVNMIGKIRLGKNNDFDGGDETIIYPATKFLEKKPKKRKIKSSVVNNNIIDDLELEDTNDDDQRIKIRPSRKTSTTKTIKNAFYN